MNTTLARLAGAPSSAPASAPEERGWEYLEEGMSNFDRHIPDSLDAKLRAGGCYCGYAGWDFYAEVWFEDGKFHAHVNQYRCHVATISANTLRELMDDVSAEYGSN